MVAITAATNVTVRITGQGVPGPSGATAVHAATHSAGAADPISVENLATAGGVGAVPTSDGAGAMTMQVPSGGGNVQSPGAETAGNLAEFTGTNAIAETALTTAAVAGHLTNDNDPHDTIDPHVAMADPHTQYQLESEKNSASGYAGLDGSTKLSGTQQTYGSALNTATEGNDSRVPSQGENDALVGTNGTPATGNPYVTDSDARNTDARAPTGAAGGDLAGTYGSPSVAAVTTTTGPTSLVIGAVAEGEVLTRSGSTLIGTVAGGGGDFSGPGSSTTDNLVGFADTTGKLGKDSGILTANVELNTNKNLASGYAGLDVSSKLTGSQQVYGTGSNTATQGNDARVPSQGENDALVGTDGTPATGNPYVTDSDSRNTDSRTPTAHAASHENGGGDEINVAGLSGLLADPQTPATHTIVSHDTTATGAELTELTDGSTTVLHAHAITGNEDLTNGVLTGGLVTINGGDNTTFDVAAGVAIVVDWTTPSAPVRTIVNFGPFTAESIPDINQGFTTILVDAAGALIKNSGVLETPQQRRIAAPLQGVQHQGPTIEFVSTDRTPAFDVIQALIDYVFGLGPINAGNLYEAAASNLTLAKTSGTTTIPFLNQTVDAQDPTRKSNPVVPSAALVPYEFRDFPTGFQFDLTQTTVDPDRWDDGSGTRATVQNNKWTVQRCLFAGRTDLIGLIYGQAEYNSAAEAEAAIFTENPVINPGATATTVFTTALVIKKGATDLSNPADAIFIEINTATTGGTGGGPATWLSLLDTTTASYVGLAGFSTQVTAGESGLELVENPTAHNTSTAAHTNLSKIDGSIDYTGEVVVVTPTVSGSAANKGYVDGEITTHAGNADAHHAEAHTIASHSDTTATGSELETLTDGSNADALHVHAGSGPPEFGDDVFRVQGSADATKELAFEVDALTTATTRTVTMPDKNLTLDDIADTRTPAAHTIASHSDTSATGAELDTLTDGSNADALHTHAGGGPGFIDDVFRINDDGDNTKQIAFQASGITTATTRTITVPNKDITLDDVGDTRTPAAHAIASHSDTSATGAELDTLTDGSNADALHSHAGAGPTFADDVFRVQDNADLTKQVAFQASGITTATTRTITVPDKNLTLDDIADTRTPAAHTIASHSDTSATGAELDTLTDGSNADALHAHAGVGPTFLDSTFRVQDDGDTSKQIAFQASGITTATTRVVSVPDKNILLDDVADTRTPAAHTIASHSDTSATGAELDTLTDTSNADALHTHGDFSDATFRVQDDVDPTKEMAFQISGVATATVRTVTMPNKNLTLDDIADTRTPAAHTIASHSDTTATGPELNTLTDNSNADSLHTHTDFTDNTFRVKDNTDPTKLIAFEASTIATATTRTVTVPNKNVLLDDAADTRVPSGSATGDLGGTYPAPSVAALTTTTGPTSLVIGAVADGQLLQRSGSTVIGVASAGGGDFSGPASSVLDQLVAFANTTGKLGKDSGVLTADVFLRDGTVVATGEFDLADNEIDNVKGAKLNGIIDKGDQPTSVTVDFDDGHVQEINATGDVAITLSATGLRTGLVIKITQGTSPPHVPTFGTNVHLTNGGAAPAWSATLNDVDILSGWTDGTTFYMFFGGDLAQNV